MHLAGIIPVAGLKSDFRLDTPEILLPINADYTAIQKAVFECAMAGCKTIWIVANDDLAPIVRKRVGEWIYDPVYLYRRNTEIGNKEYRKEIPIYYVPIHPKHRDRKDSHGWAALYGMHAAFVMSYRISKWVVPDKYFVAFPMAAYNVYDLRPHRLAISDKNHNFFATHKDKTIKDGLPLPFTMFEEDFKRCRNLVNKTTTREYLPIPPDQKYPDKKRPLADRWSARHFSLAEVFSETQIKKTSHKLPLDWFYDLSSWDEYCAFLGSDNSIETPEKMLTTPHKHDKMCVVNNEEEEE